MNKILVSGGWGYGNLGDDALLIATVDLLILKYPKSKLVITSYNHLETKNVLKDYDVSVVPSIHRMVSKKLAFHKLGTNGKTFDYCGLPKLLQRVIGKCNYQYVISKGNHIFQNRERIFNNIVQTEAYKGFEDADLFIMSGGGYFNSWTDNLTARVIELKLAKKANLKSLVIGQSIGPFVTKELSEYAYSGLKYADIISVRDKESLMELTDLNLRCDISPDLALASINFAEPTTNEVSIILGGFPDSKIDELVMGLKNVSNKLKCTYKFLITRLYNSDVLAVKKIYKILIDEGVDAKLIIPTSYVQLQKELANSSIVVSRNLHGLIMGWRAGVPSVCLHHERKFVTFMEQSGQINRLLDVNELTKEKLSDFILDAAQNKRDIDEKRKSLSKFVTDHFMEKLTQLEKA